MSANDQFVRANTARANDDSGVNDAPLLSSANEAYYVLLAERLEALLQDMKQNGTPASDPLLVRLSDLLVETRGLLGNGRSADESQTSVSGR